MNAPTPLPALKPITTACLLMPSRASQFVRFGDKLGWLYFDERNARYFLKTTFGDVVIHADQLSQLETATMADVQEYRARRKFVAEELARYYDSRQETGD